MNKNTFYFIVLITLNLVLSVTAQSNNTQNITVNNKCGDNCHWSIEETTLKFTGNGKMKDFYSDNEIPWKSQLQQITKITITGISSIGQKAFQNMKALKTIEFGDVTEIGAGAFYNTGIENITIPKSVKTIKKNAFTQNLQLKTVTFAADSQLETIEEKAFKNCPEITQIVLPDSLKITERKVFEGCEKMATISIGTNLEQLGSQIFSKCESLTTITIKDNNNKFSTINNVIFNKDQTELVYYPIALETKEYTIPSTVKTIKKEAFLGSHLDSVVFNANLKTIEEKAFYGNKHLIQLSFMSNLEVIENTAFAGCRVLENITFLSRITIHDQAFIGARKLNKVIYTLKDQPTCPNNVFDMTLKLRMVTVHKEYPSDNFCGKYSSKTLVAGDIGKTDNDNVHYYIDTNGTLVIFGNGYMKDFTGDEKAPWEDYKDVVIKHVIIEEGVKILEMKHLKIWIKSKIFELEKQLKI